MPSTVPVSDAPGSLAKPLLPDWTSWARCLGLPDGTDVAAVIAALDAQLSKERWYPLGSVWPSPGQRVMVALKDESTQKRWTCAASFVDEAASPLSLMLTHQEPGQDPEYPFECKPFNVDTLQQRARGIHFSMSGGDWSATFMGPRFARRGMDYTEKATEPWILITHWRAYPDVPMEGSIG